ncbi:helix-turn-helix domain-containing protein, partial [Bradyrhizobium sp.]|uniref:helix-turn-helix domain-containing protein n=1 Tax=Bradyrhizobium sp. TaxID=376 RepID=UPI003C509319
MSIKAMTWAFGLPLEPRAKIALLAIADNARDDGVAWPSRDLIAEKSSQSRATINRRMKILQGLGVLSLHERYRSDGSQTTDEIHLDLTLTPADVLARMQAQKQDNPAEDEAENDDDTGYQADTPPMSDSTPGESVVQPGGYHCGNPQDEPSLEPIPPPNPPPSAGGPLSKTDREANEKRAGLWNKFLGSYPNVVAMDQDAAKAEFLKLSLEHCAWAVAAAPGYEAECRKIGKPPKNAHLWLRKGMFRNLPQTGGAVASGNGQYPRDSLEAK